MGSAISILLIIALGSGVGWLGSTFAAIKPKLEEDSDDDLQRLLRASSHTTSHESLPDTPTPSRRGKVGRPVGPQPKRKAEEDLSENYNTKRARQRLKSFTKDEKLVERAKRNDQVSTFCA